MWKEILFPIGFFIFVFFSRGVCTYGCSNMQPPTCTLPVGADTSMIYALIIDSPPTDVTVFSGHHVSLELEVNVSLLLKSSSVIMKVFLDGCLVKEKQCGLEPVCRIEYKNMNDLEDGAKVVFYVFVHSSGFITSCVDPPTTLHVRGPPSDVQILKIRMSAFNDLTVTVSAIEQNTELYYEFIFENQTVIYNGKSSNSTLIIPGKFLLNLAGIYLVRVTPHNPAGPGNTTSKKFKLKDLIYLVEKASIIVINETFYAKIQIKINCCSQELLLSKLLKISSSCSSETLEYQLHGGTQNEEILYQLLPNRHHCYLSVVNNGQVLNKSLNQSTYHTQIVEYSLNNYNFVLVTCHFTEGSNADGCVVRVTANNNLSNDKYIISKMDSLPVGKNIGPLKNGINKFSVYDFIDGWYDDSHVVDEKVFNISIPMISSAHLTPTVTFHPPVKCGTDAHCAVLTLTEIGFIIGGASGIAVIVGVVILSVCVWRSKKRKGINLQDADDTSYATKYHSAGELGNSQFGIQGGRGYKSFIIAEKRSAMATGESPSTTETSVNHTGNTEDCLLENSENEVTILPFGEPETGDNCEPNTERKCSLHEVPVLKEPYRMACQSVVLERENQMSPH